MTPTKATLDRWKPEQLKIAGIGALATTIITESDAADRLYDLPKAEWSGDARTAATERAGQESAWAKRVAAKVSALDKALSKAGAAIGPTLTAVDNALHLASSKHFTLVSEHDPSWKMHYNPPADDDSTPEEIAQKEHEWASYVKVRADAAHAMCQTHAAKITAAVTALGSLTPAVLGLSAQDGRRDADMSKDGWTPAELRQVGEDLKAAGLTDEQIKTLLDGGTVTDMPVGAQEYLHQFFGNLDENGVLALKDKFDAMGTPEGKAWSESLGKGFLALSNEKVGFSDGENNMVAGGFGSLPAWAQQWATARDSQTNPLPFRNTMRMAALLDNTSGMQPGEQFGSELIRKTADLAARSDPKDGVTVPEFGFGGMTPDESRSHYEGTMEQLLGVGARNHEASTAILTGHFADGGALPDGYDRDHTLSMLGRHEWRDNGTGIGHLVEWIGEDGNSSDPTKSALADRAFSGMFDYATTTKNIHGDNNFANLMNINHDRDSVGQINPEFADALRKAAHPYLNYLANPDAHNDITGHKGLDLADHDSTNDFRARGIRLFALIASDDAPPGCSLDNPDGGPNTATKLAADILEQTNKNAAQAAHDSGFARALGDTSGELRELGRGGIYGAQFDHEIDTKEAVDAANSATKNTQQTIDSASALVSILPFGGAASGVADAASPWLLNDVPKGDVPFNIGSGSDIFGSTDEAKQSLSSAYSVLQGSNPARDHPEWYSHGQLKPIDQLLRESEGDASQLNQAITEHLKRIHQIEPLEQYEKGRDDARTNDDLQYNPTTPDAYEDWIRDGLR